MEEFIRNHVRKEAEHEWNAKPEQAGSAQHHLWIRKDTSACQRFETVYRIECLRLVLLLWTEASPLLLRVERSVFQCSSQTPPWPGGSGIRSSGLGLSVTFSKGFLVCIMIHSTRRLWRWDLGLGNGQATQRKSDFWKNAHDSFFLIISIPYPSIGIHP